MTYSRFWFGPKLVLQGQVHPAEQHKPEDEEPDDPDAHHEVKISPIPGSFF